jgi:hypothetical protein
MPLGIDRLRGVEALYVGMLIAAGLLVTGFSGYAVYRLSRGQT